ncbi:hypothetical protein HHK36_011910 [Tetracentron sinense]|uniref:PTM/DIR17-like Tudor domain-containing protein n=1 Tax=Tetracentron sinense TaxID=13715 RepID=A0A835DKW8_TETSI|nr:hypothetical protein HHK36_011910 [Tetracentron sinense]
MDDKVSCKKISGKKAKSASQKGVDGKSKAKDVASKKYEKKLPESKHSRDGLLKDEHRKKCAGDKSNGSNAAENSKEKSDLGGGNEVEKKGNAAKGDVGKMKERDAAHKAVRKKPMEKKSRSTGVVDIGKGESDAKRKFSAEEENAEHVKTTAKRRRGADGVIAQAFLSSPQVGSSWLRPRKKVASFRKVELSESDCNRIIGKRLKVFWSGSRKWFVGRIKSFDNEKKLHKILYDDGDKEELDLKRERFELEVMPDEAFTLCFLPKPSPEENEVSPDGDEVSAGTMEVDLQKAGAVEPVIKNSKPKKKLASKSSKKRSSKSQGRKNSEKVEDLDTDMEVDVLPKNVEVKVIIGEIIDAEKHRDANCGKDQDESGSLSKLANGTNETSVEAQSTKSESDPEKKEKGGEVTGKSVKEDLVKAVNTKPVQNHIYMKRKKSSKAAKMRSSMPRGGKGSKDEDNENRATDGELDAPPEKVEKNAMCDEIDVEKSEDFSYQKDHYDTESLAKLASEETGGTSYEAQAAKPEPDHEKKLTGSDSGEVNGKTMKDNSLKAGDAEQVKNRTKMKIKLVSKVANRGSSKQQGVKDNLDEKVEDLSTNTEVDVYAEKVEENVIIEEILFEGPADVNSGKDHNDTESVSIVASKTTNGTSDKEQPTKSKSLSKEENPELLEGKQKTQDSESAGDRAKEELRDVNISERGLKGTEGLQQAADKQSKNDESQVGWASQKMISTERLAAQTLNLQPLSDEQTKKDEGLVKYGGALTIVDRSADIASGFLKRDVLLFVLYGPKPGVVTSDVQYGTVDCIALLKIKI